MKNLRAGIFLILASLSFLSLATAGSPSFQRVQIWHQMMYTPREVLREVADDFEKQNPDIKVQLIYKETEELRSSFQAAALGGSGPELIYGPCDQVGPFATMGLLYPLDDYFSKQELSDFDPLSQVQYQNHLWMIGDTVGNHLHLIYNRDLVKQPPQTVEQLIRLAKELTIDRDHDGKPEQYGFAFHMMEPFFFVPWVKGFGRSFVTVDGFPQLDSPAVVQAFQLMKRLRDESIMPKEADYEITNALFKQKKVAMIINGDWSWGDYQQAKIPFGVARIPKIDSTGLWPAPLVSTKGYSLNKNIPVEKRDATLKLLKYLVSPEVQLRFTAKISSLPSSLSARKSKLVTENLLLKDSADIMSVAEPMSVAPELRAVWDALRPQYQAVLTTKKDPLQASQEAQAGALAQIQVMNHVDQPQAEAGVIKFIFFAVLVILFGLFIREIPKWIKELKGPSKMAYGFLIPTLLLLFFVILVPLAYSITISFSNLGLKTFSSWQVVGLQNYTSWLTSTELPVLFGKTILWTGVNILFHVTLGVLLALCLNDFLPAKPVFRTLLILPWAVPQYITALTWRGLFNQEYGAINTVLQSLLHLTPVQWLSRPWETFSACILTNIWLGFPFMMVVALAGLQSIPMELYEAARVDGANAWQRFWKITWPQLMLIMRPAMLLGSIWTFNNLNVVWLVSNGGEPSDQTHILVSSVYKSAFHLYRYGSSAALSMLIFLLLLGGTWILWRIQRGAKS